MKNFTDLTNLELFEYDSFLKVFFKEKDTNFFVETITAPYSQLTSTYRNDGIFYYGFLNNVQNFFIKDVQFFIHGNEQKFLFTHLDGISFSNTVFQGIKITIPNELRTYPEEESVEE